jgi:3-hydroxyisobutyrate dehydrogenase-like beta-hydroxyacid dehydrogenase
MGDRTPSRECNAVVIGLGSMGYGMAQSLLRAGFPVWGFDLDAAREEKLRGEGGLAAARAEAAQSADAVVSVVVNAAQTEAMLFGDDGIAPHMRPGAVFISCATLAPEAARGLASRLASAGVDYLDAPISGGSARAAEGRLTMMASGSAQAFAKAAPALEAIAETVFRLGEAVGAGSAMKIVNQLLAGVHIAAAAEAVTFAMTQGIGPAQALDVISKCAGNSWMFENRVPHIVEGDYRPRSAVEIFVKDLGIVSDVARAARFSAPLAAAALQQFLAASGAGFGREDDAAVAKIYARNAGLTLPGEG